MSEIDPSLQLAEMRAVAFRLGMAFGQEAERADGFDRKMALFDAFHRCFASVRLAIALDLRLKKTSAQAVYAERETERAEPLERDPPEHDGPERYDERDRDRETERATLPILLRTLERVATDAETLLRVPPAELPTLRELLARVKAQATAQPQGAAPLRTRLTGSATAPALLLAQRPGSGLRSGPTRRSTGPP